MRPAQKGHILVLLVRLVHDLIAVHGYFPDNRSPEVTGYNLAYLSTAICKIYGKQFFRNVLSIFIGQIPLSRVSAGAYGAGKCFNGQHKSNIFLLRLMICT